MSVNNTEKLIQKTGYDLSVYGLNDGSFFTIHIMAISCLSLSMVCDFVTVVFSFRVQHYKGFFRRWQKGDRFVIYVAVFDIIYCGCHLADHIHILIVKDHVYPKALCVWYAFTILSMVLVQNLLVNLIAINVFALIYFGYNLNFGKNDWRLLTWTLGVPMIVSALSAALGKLGPSGAYCFFDAITGATFYLAIIAIPQIVILLTNSTLYLLTWLKLYSQLKAMKTSVGTMSTGMKATHTAAKSMATFVAAYIVRWWALTVSCFMAVTHTAVPQVVIQLIVFFSNTGGILNLLVFIVIRRGRTGNANSNDSSGHAMSS